MDYRPLGKSRLVVSSVAFGGWAIVGGFTWGPQEKSDSLAALRTAYDHGVTLFDTAELYGDGTSEQLLAEALGDVREHIVIASKVATPHFSKNLLRASCERSLRNLRTDRMDLYQLHWPTSETPPEETFETLETLKQEGKILEYGVSNFGPENMRSFLGKPWTVRSNQLAYNLLFRAIEFEIQPLCVQHGLSILCYCPMMQGLLTGKFRSADDVPAERARTRHFSPTRPHVRHHEPGAEKETFEAIERIRAIVAETGESMAHVTLAWLLTQPGVASVIVGARHAQQAAENARAADIRLSDDVRTRLDAATRPLKDHLGRNPDMWQTPSRIA